MTYDEIIQDAIAKLTETARIQEETREQVDAMQRNVKALVNELTIYRALGSIPTLLIYVHALTNIFEDIGAKDNGRAYLAQIMQKAQERAYTEFPDMFPPAQSEFPEGCPGWGRYSMELAVCALCELNFRCLAKKSKTDEGKFSEGDVQWIKNLEDLLPPQ